MYWNTLTMAITINTLKFELPTMCQLCSRMTNSADPDQTAPWEQFDLDLHCLLRRTLRFYGKKLISVYWILKTHLTFAFLYK